MTSDRQRKARARRGGTSVSYETAHTLSRRQRDISVSEFFLKNRHLLGFDNPRKALLTAVKEAVDNSLDACEEAGVLPEISVDIEQVGTSRFRVSVTDNGPGIIREQIPRIFAKLLYGSKFHRLRMSRGQQGMGISAAGMYGQLTTSQPTVILSRTGAREPAHHVEVMIDTRKNQPVVVRDRRIDWRPEFFTTGETGRTQRISHALHGTMVSIVLEGNYIRGKLSVDEYLRQCAVVNPHLELHYRIRLPGDGAAPWIRFRRATERLPPRPAEIRPHPHGVELGMLIQILKDASQRTLKAALRENFCRVSSRVAEEICRRAGLDPGTRPARIAQGDAERLYKAISHTRIVRPPIDCLSPIGEEQLLLGLKKEIQADFYTAVTRPPAVYRGNPFQIEVALAYARPGENPDLGAEDPVRVLRFANRVPLLYMSGACAMTRAVASANWRNYGLSQPRNSLPLGPMVVLVHIASVWVPFVSESKEAVAHYPEIVREMTFALQECGRRLAVYLNRRRRQAEAQRKLQHIEKYIPHLALGLKEILALSERQERAVVNRLRESLERSRLQLSNRGKG
ncbi:MAG TPA: DNA topoisomerase VI subunit B [Kiritimatiellae bacterium]|nr:DNA topoisomerase VI subunit B [Kiritimatiellia bacterium]